MLFTELKKRILVPRYNLSKSAVFHDFFEKCIGNPGILGIRKFASLPIEAYFLHESGILEYKQKLFFGFLRGFAFWPFFG